MKLTKWARAAVTGAMMVAAPFAEDAHAAYLIDVSGQFTNTFAVGPFATALKNTPPLSDNPTFRMQLTIDETSGKMNAAGTFSDYKITPLIFQINGSYLSNLSAKAAQVITFPNYHAINLVVGGDTSNISGIIQFQANMSNSVTGANFSGNVADYSNGTVYSHFQRPFGTSSLAQLDFTGLAGTIVINPVASIPDSGTAVPEPATWSLLILGFGGIGAAMRRRMKRASALAAA